MSEEPEGEQTPTPPPALSAATPAEESPFDTPEFEAVLRDLGNDPELRHR